MYSDLQICHVGFEVLKKGVSLAQTTNTQRCQKNTETRTGGAEKKILEKGLGSAVITSTQTGFVGKGT